MLPANSLVTPLSMVSGPGDSHLMDGVSGSDK